MNIFSIESTELRYALNMAVLTRINYIVEMQEAGYSWAKFPVYMKELETLKEFIAEPTNESAVDKYHRCLEL